MDARWSMIILVAIIFVSIIIMLRRGRHYLTPLSSSSLFGGAGLLSPEQAAAAVAAFAYSADPHSADPYNLHARFVQTQRREFALALHEIRAGRKVGHWSWFCVPTAPFVLDGVEVGSLLNRRYALRDRPPRDLEGFDAARAYLDFPATAKMPTRTGRRRAATAAWCACATTTSCSWTQRECTSRRGA
jgi:hypothetical protein